MSAALDLIEPPLSGPPQSRRRRRSRTSTLYTLLIWALLIAGTAGVSWELWMRIGTVIVAKSQAEATSHTMTTQWEKGSDTPIPTSHGQASALVSIPALDVKQIPLMTTDDDEALKDGFGLSSPNLQPGDKGNFAIAGHRVTHIEPLRNMAQLQPGDEIIIETRTTTYTYTLTTSGSQLRVHDTDGWVLTQPTPTPPPEFQDLIPEGKRLLTLITCAETFKTPDRWVAFATLTQTTPK